MTRRLTLAFALLAVAALTLLPGVAFAQTGSPPVVGGVVVEAPDPPLPVAGVVVNRPDQDISGTKLPRTGSDVIPMAVGAVGLLLVGTVLVVSTRRRLHGGSVSLA